MNLKIKGLVIRQKNFLNEQKFLTILTSSNGLIRARLKIGGQISRSVFSNVNVLGYYDFNIFEGRFGSVIDSVEAIELFFNLRYDPKKLALAQYFCELTDLFVPSKQRAEKHLNLLLNSLWLLCGEKFSCQFIKLVFEFRVVAISGYMPDLVGCKFCCSYEKQRMFYVLNQGFLVCSDCLGCGDFNEIVELSRPVLHAMRFIIYKDDRDIFKFRLDINSQNSLSCLVERLVLIFLESKPKTLNIYHQFCKEF